MLDGLLAFIRLVSHISKVVAYGKVGGLHIRLLIGRWLLQQRRGQRRLAGRRLAQEQDLLGGCRAGRGHRVEDGGPEILGRRLWGGRA